MPTIRAPITGSVCQIDVAPGDRVEVEQLVALLESMKLEIPVEAQVAGTVARVLVSVGESVVEGQSMVELR